MKLLQQILKEAGADLDKSFTVVPSFGGYFKSVKRIVDYTPQKIVLSVARFHITVVGDNLLIDKFFQQDLFIRGNVTGVSVE